MARVPRYVGWPLVVASGYGVLYWLANRSIYYPLKYPRGRWDAQRQLGAADVWLRAADGTRLHGWWLAAADARLATVFLHGNAGNVTHRAAHMLAIAAAGSSVLVIDYRGYGRSEGRPSERGLYADAEAAYDHLLGEGWAPERVVIHGESLGTSVAVELAARRPCAGLILEAPFSSARDVAARILPVLGPMLVRSFDTKSRIRRVRAPLLVIHGGRDDIIPPDLGRALFEASPDPKEFWSLEGAGHNDILAVAGPRYQEMLQRFYRRCCP